MKIKSYYGKEITSLDEQKQLMLGVMDCIHTFCKENNLNYFLLGGTLIGAIRHKGFIPWDDDMDIGMVREDYDRFIEEFNDKNSRYQIVYSGNDPKYHLPYVKVIDTETVLVENINKTCELGMFVDVFPVERISGDYNDALKIAKKLRIIQRPLEYKNMLFEKKRGIVKNIILAIIKVCLAFVSKHRLIVNIEKHLVKYSTEDKNCDWIVKLAFNPNLQNSIFKTNWLDEYIEWEFEGRMYSIPKEYDAMLTTYFGDYMQLPPEEERVSNHGFRCWWKNNNN